MNLGAPELLIILLVVLVLFGGTKLPKLARSLGQAQKEFKEGLRDPDGDHQAAATPPTPPAPPAPPSGPISPPSQGPISS